MLDAHNCRGRAQGYDQSRGRGSAKRSQEEREMRGMASLERVPHLGVVTLARSLEAEDWRRHQTNGGGAVTDRATAVLSPANDGTRTPPRETVRPADGQLERVREIQYRRG